MIERNVRISIPLTQGHYGGPADTVGDLLANSKIPLGFFYGEDVIIDDCGYIRARPELLYYEGSWGSSFTASGGNDTSVVFRNGSTYYSAGDNAGAGADKLEYYSGGWTAITGTGAAYTWPSQNHVEYISAAPSTSSIAILSTGSSDKLINYVSGTAATVSGMTNAKGLAGQDEDRLFCWTGGYIHFSDRGDYSDGYDQDDEGEWFSLGPSCYKVVGMMNVGGALHIIKQSEDGSNMLIWRKVQTLTDDSELIDQTWFTSPLGVNNTYLGNGYDGLCSIGGNILAWGKGQGLASLIDGGMELNCEAVRCHRQSNLDYDCVLAPCDNHRVVLVKPSGLTDSWVYDYMNKRWYKWNVDVTCKGFGERGGMFGVSGTKAPAKLGDYPTDNDDTTIVPIVYTPAMDFDYPAREKDLKKILLQHENVTEVKVYYRLDPADAFTLHQTVSTPGRVINLTPCRGGEFYFKITANPTVLVKSLGVEFDVLDTIYEG